MKQFKLTFLLTMLMSMVGAKAFAHDIEVANADGVTIYYTYTNNKTELAVSYRGSSYSSYSNEYSGVVNIPESVTYNGKTYPVTSIGSYAFWNCSGLTSVTIPNSVTSIGEYTFSSCKGLTSVNIGNSVTSIGRSAFSGCTGLTSIDIPNSVTSIGNDAFYKCSGLTSVTIGNSVTSIGNYAFYDCTGLTSVTIPNSVTSIGEGAFQDCSGLTSVTIPNSVTSIGYRAFEDCNGLTSVTIGNSVTSIGYRTFYNCNPKKVIWFPSTPPSYYEDVSADVHYVPNDSYTSLSSKAVYPYLASMFEVDGVKYVPVSPSEKTCDAIDCVYDTSVEDIKIGNTVTYRGITMTVKNVNRYLCCANPHVKNVKVENNGNIGYRAFSGCRGLTSVTIGNSVTSISEQAFSGCSGLQKVIVNDIAAWCNISFGNYYGTSNDDSNPLSYAGHLYSDENTEITNLVIPDEVTSIKCFTFYGCSGLTSVTIPNSVTSIGHEAFYGCSGLTSVTIPTSVTNIVKYAFYRCSGLTSVTINSNAIASKNYNSSSSLKDIFGGQVMQYVLGDDITSIGDYVFYQCSALTSLTIPNSVTSIGKYAFSGCSGLTSIYIPDSVKTIGNYTFQNCSGLTSVTIGNSVTNIGDYAFIGCTNITKLTSCATTPPRCGRQALNDINKWDCTLVVPVGSKSAYQAADQWKDFFFIEESDMTAINRIYDDEAEGRIEGIYDLNGRKLERLQRSMNIVRMSDGTTKKIVVK